MHYLLTIIVMLTCLSTAMTAFSSWAQISSDEKCLGKDGKYYAIGESWSDSEECSQSYCSKGSENQVVVSFESCGAYGAPAGCNVTHDYGKDFPECCSPVYKCN